MLKMFIDLSVKWTWKLSIKKDLSSAYYKFNSCILWSKTSFVHREKNNSGGQFSKCKIDVKYIEMQGWATLVDITALKPKAIK